MPKYDDVTVKLVGQDGNVFVIIGKVSRALRRAGHRDGMLDYTNAAQECESYEAVLRLTMDTVNVE